MIKFFTTLRGVYNFVGPPHKVFAKNSFDRFGDDSNELILSDLTFEDKIRLECVSKQWQKCVFENKFVIEYSEQYVSECHFENQNSLNRLIQKMAINCGLIYCSVFNRPALESVLKKCANISKIILRFLSNSSNIENVVSRQRE